MSQVKLTAREAASYCAGAPHHRWWCGIGSSDVSGTPTADSARTPREGCVLCRGRMGCLACFFLLLRCSRRRSVGAPGAGNAAAVVAGCPLVVVPDPPSQQMSCQRLRMERRACVPPVSSQMKRNRRQSRDQRQQQSSASSGPVVGSARGGRATPTKRTSSATTAGEAGAGGGRAGTAAGCGVRAPIAAAAPRQPTRGAVGRRREHRCQCTFVTATATAAC